MAEIMQLDSHQRCHALAILRSTLFALRPLTDEELTHALAVVDDDDCVNLCVNELPDDVDDEYVAGAIVNICPSLVGVRREGAAASSVGTSTIHFVHFSIRQYLTSVTSPLQLVSFYAIPFADIAI